MANEELIIQLSIMEQKAQQIEQQLQLIDENLIDLERLKDGLDELKNAKGKEIFASIGRGIFVKAKIDDEEILTDVGGRNFVKKDLSETKKILDEQSSKLSVVRDQLLQELQTMNIEFQTMIEKIENEKKED